MPTSEDGYFWCFEAISYCNWWYQTEKKLDKGQILNFDFSQTNETELRPS